MEGICTAQVGSLSDSLIPTHPIRTFYLSSIYERKKNKQTVLCKYHFCYVAVCRILAHIEALCMYV